MSPMVGRPAGRSLLVATLPHVAYAALVLWLFSGTLLEGRVLFFRDLSTFFYPNFVFLERSLAQGVWPLWNPGADAGAPFLQNGYPLDLLVVSAFGASRALALVPPLHTLIALSGTFFLGRRLGMEAWGAWTAGVAFGAGGYFLSSVNLLPILQAGALAPWVLAAALALFERPTGRRAAALGAVTALQVSTLAGEIVVLTWLVLPFLMTKRPTRRSALALGGSALLAALLLAPVLGNVASSIAGTQRAAGFDAAQALGYSARVPVLLEALLPRFFGDVHAFTYHGFWGQAFFPEGNPYFLSLYLGPVALVAALAAGRHRVWLLVLLGIVLSLGEYGPLAPVLPPLLRVFRAPVKFFFLCALGVSVLAGVGVTKGMKAAPPGLGPALVGAAMALAGALLLLPGTAAPLLAALPAEFQDSGALWAAQEVWPGRFLLSGLLALAAALALARGARLVPFVPAVLAFDLLIVNGGLNTTANRDFYELRAPMKSLVQSAQREGLYRWFSYGVANATGLTWAPEILRRNADVWLYYLDRQALLPRTNVLDGLEGAFDIDRTGLAPRGSVLGVEEASPPRFPSIAARLRLANVRWVLSFDPLPEEIVVRRAEVPFAEVSPPMALFELRDPLPRAFWVGRAEVLTDSRARDERLRDPTFPAREAVLLDAPLPPGLAAPGADARGSVVFESIDAHHVRLHASGAPGFVVVLSGHHPGWKASGPEGPVPLLRANGRYWAVPTRGGDRVIDVRFAPPWVVPSLGLLALGALASVALALRARGEV
jgi:hypothetical protein